MNLLRYVVPGILIAVVVAGCGGDKKVTPPPAFNMTRIEKPVAGLVWSRPSTWLPQHDLPMRVATYIIPSGREDLAPGECGVFYFGKDQGGDVKTNIERWGAQFEGAKQAEESTKKVNGIDITVVRINGTYLAPGGPEMKSQGKKENYRLLGAIVAGPQGSVFFKCTGPAAVITGSEDAFSAMLDSIEKE